MYTTMSKEYNSKRWAMIYVTDVHGDRDPGRYDSADGDGRRIIAALSEWRRTGAIDGYDLDIGEDVGPESIDWAGFDASAREIAAVAS